MEVDYLIIGQGLAGSLLGYNLLKANKKILIVDDFEKVTSSKIAAGIYNPITGRRLVKTWMADSLFPFLETYYTELEKVLGAKILHKKPIFRPFDSIADQNYWYGQSSDEAFKNYIQLVANDEDVMKHFNAPFGGFYTNSSGYIQVKLLLDAFLNYFSAQNIILNDKFSDENLIVTENKIQYRDITASDIVFCQGFKNKDNLIFNYLPIEPTKGQILDIEIDHYNVDSIVNKRVFILPENNYQRIGSTYERDYLDEIPTQNAIKELTDKLDLVLKSPYKIIGQNAAIRPTVVDRKPLLGSHPKHSNVFIFNGLGTKGVSIAPYFSLEMANFMVHHKPLLAEVDIRRFDYLYH